MKPSITSLIDHAVLHPTQTDEDVRVACALCDQAGVASICVKPSHVALAAELLNDSAVLISTVIGFPHGGTHSNVKVAETVLACQQGAKEVDMVINLGAALSEKWDEVAKEIALIVRAARDQGALTKVILETGLLPNDEVKRRLCEISEQAGAAFVKTSTGFGCVKAEDGSLRTTGATEHDIRLMRATCGPNVQIKASGGIRSYEDAVRFVELGATRLGTSGTQAIVQRQRAQGDY